MSLIYSIGRASSLKNYNYDLIKAATLRNQALKLVDFNKRKSIDILFSLNNNQEYINYARTTISSILLNADLDSDYNFYFIMDNQDPISSANQNRINSLHHLGPYETKFITLPKNILDNKNAFNDPLVRLIFQRFLVEDVLANLDSIITLDLDILVLRDLYKLQYQEDFDQKILAGSLDYMTINRKELCDFRYTYINSGVTVQNLSLMRNLKSSTYLIDKYQNKNSKNEQCFIMPEQDTLNMAYKDQIKPISRRWNKLTEFNYNIDYLPFILHFAGNKPSETNKSPEHLLYMQYKDLSNHRAN
jgi:lipopolysaccharide biosynthesis glycosyltransferase